MRSLDYPDDDLSDEQPSHSQREKRFAEITAWFQQFGDFCLENGEVEVVFASDAAESINNDYWEMMYKDVRKRIQPAVGVEPKRADRHKIASLMELLIVHHGPIEHSDEVVRREMNADLAFFVAKNIIVGWHKDRLRHIHVSDSFDREHRTWLIQCQTYSENNPIFSNAATWYLVELILFERNPEL